MERRLSGIEALWWVGGQHPFHFAMSARIRGTLSVDQLQAALVKVRQKRPILAIRLFTTEDQMWCTSKGVADFPIRVIARTGDDDWMRAVEADFDNLFPGESGPLLRFVLLTQPEVSDLVMIFHHCMYDGLSAAYALREILYYLTQPDAPAEPEPMPPGISDLIPEPAIQALTQNAPSGNPPESPIMTFTAASAEDHQLRIFSWSLTEEQTTALIRRCREEQTSLQGAICVALMFAYADLNIGRESASRIVATPINLRPRLKEPVSETIGMLITPTPLCDVDCQPGRHFWDEARAFKSQLNGQNSDEALFALMVDSDQVIGAAPYSRVVDDFLHMVKTTPTPFDMLVTNLGVLPLPTDYGSLHLEAVYGPMVLLKEGECVCGVSTIGGKAFFTLTYRNLLMSLQTAEQLIQQMTQHLKTALLE
jgi:hypothetical protein